MRSNEIMPLWGVTDDPFLMRREVLSDGPASARGGKHRAVTMPRIPDCVARFFQRYGLILTAVLFLAVWTAVACAITAHNVRRDTEEAVTLRMEAEMQRRLTAQEIAFRTENLLSDGEAMQIEEEADAIAGVIGKMKTKRMKRSMAWNIIVRVDNPAYADTVAAVIAQPDQWMFYNPAKAPGPIREDDKAIALEIVKQWHDGIYPEDLHVDDVYGEWSENDYVLRNTYEKGPNTHYWRAPEK